MATAVAPKPSAPHQTKMKRPPLPAVQTNGVHSSQSSRSPSTSTKRAPGFKQPPTPTVNGVNGDVNGLGPRLSNRRKDSTKPGDGQGRPSRAGRPGQDGERKVYKKRVEPFIRTQSYILKRHRNKPPSLIIHLHPTHFRFDTQDGSFSYNSPMKFVLEHLKSQTVPHDMMEELIAAGTRFYEGCLIIQVQDHRSNSGPSSNTSDTTQNDGYVPFSIHNYNEHLTPSPYVPYPKKAQLTTKDDSKDAGTEANDSSIAKDKQQHVNGPNLFHVVLFPTPLSIHEEVIIQANTVDPRHNNRKQSSNVPRTPASATIPPTPSSAIQSTSFAGGPPAKKQKMTISGHEIQGFESTLVNMTAPPLHLDPVENLDDAHKLLEDLTDPRHKESHPPPKIKKRTEAELAADEAIAAQQEAFMLIMDERLTSGPAGARAAATDGESGIPTFQPNFEQWQAIRTIKAEHKERHAREMEARKLREEAQQANKLRMEQQEQAAKMEMERRAAQVAQHQVQINAMARQNQIQRQALVASQNQSAHGHGHPMPNGVSRAQNGSPVVRTQTPTNNNNSSPSMGNAAMNPTSSAQGVTSSPARPPSAMQQGAPPNGVGMARQISRQRAPSRTSTPQMNGTPSMQQATPVIGQNATPRMPSQGSPPMGTPAIMNHNPMAGQNPNGLPVQLTPEQQHQIMEQRRIQAIHAQQRQQQQQIALQQQRMQNGSPNPQMSPEQRNPAHMQSLQQQAAMNQQRQQQDYQQSLRMHHANMGTSPQGHPNMPNGASPPQQMPGQMNPRQKLSLAQNQQLQHQIHTLQAQYINQMAQRYGGNPAAVPPAERAQCEQRAQQVANQWLNKQLKAQEQRRREQAHQLQLQHMAAMNAMPGGAMQAMGAGGMGPQSAMSEQQRQVMMQQGMQQMSQMPHLGGGGMGGVGGGGMMNGHMNGGMGGMQ